MTFLKLLPKVKYDFTLKSETTDLIDIIPDLTTRVNVYMNADSLTQLCDQYIVVNSMSPEAVADDYYGNSDLHWVVLYMNNITDLQSEWALNENALIKYCQDKYGSSKVYDFYAYVSPDGVIGDKTFIEANYGVGNYTQLSNYDFESQINDKKRIIKLIKPEFINAFVNSFNANLTT